jgi:hypothetical protein
VARRCGNVGSELLLLLIIDDTRWATISAIVGYADPKTVKVRCAEALAALAAFLAGRSVPDPPSRGRGRPRKHPSPPAAPAA